MNINDFLNFQLGWYNAWIPAVSMQLIQLAFMMIYKESGKRVVDTSWYTAKDKRNAALSSFSQMALLAVSVFVPFKFGTVWFTIGAALYALAVAMFVAAFYAYSKAPLNNAITGGIYRLSRNPMYFAFNVGMVGICIATLSLWFTLVVIPFFVTTHLLIVSEERYCEKTYGEEYKAYKEKTPRYF